MKKDKLRKNIAIIPARKNSKRIKNKNIKLFNGKPLIYWTIKIVLKTKLFDKVFVSTDSKKIKKISESAGAQVLYPRPKRLSGDFARIIDVMHFEIKKLEKKIKFQKVCCIFPTAVLLHSDSLKKGLRKLTANTNYVFSAIADEKSVLKNFFFNKGKLCLIQPAFKDYFTQALPVTYKDAGQFYWGEKKSWLNKKSIFSNNSKVILMEGKRIIDLDTMTDWKKILRIKK